MTLTAQANQASEPTITDDAPAQDVGGVVGIEDAQQQSASIGDDDDDYTPVPTEFPGEADEAAQALGAERAQEPAPQAHHEQQPRSTTGKFTTQQKEKDAQEAIDRAAFEAATKGVPFDPKAAATSQGKDADAGSSDGAEMTVEQRTELIEAKRTLRRAQWDKEDIEALPPAKLLEKASKLSKFLAEAEDDRAFRLQNDPAKGRSGQQPPANGRFAHDGDGVDRTRAAKAGDEDDIDQLLKDLDADDSADADLSPKVKERLQRAEAETQQARIELARDRVRVAELEVKAEFPIAEKATEEQKQKYLQTLAKWDPKGEMLLSGTKDEIKAMLRDAAWAVFGPQIQQQQHQDVLLRNRRQRAGQPSAPDGSSRTARAPRTQDDIDRHAFDVVMGKASPATPAMGSFARR